MYWVDDRSCRIGSETTRFRYSANDSTRRVRVKSSRTARPSSTRRARTTDDPVEDDPVEIDVSAITLNVALPGYWSAAGGYLAATAIAMVSCFARHWSRSHTANLKLPLMV